MNLPYFLRPSPSPLKHFRIHIVQFQPSLNNSSAGQWNWLPTDRPTEGPSGVLMDGHILYRTHLELVEVEAMVCDRMGWFTRWGYQYWMKNTNENSRYWSVLDDRSATSNKFGQLIDASFRPFFQHNTSFSEFEKKKYVSDRRRDRRSCRDARTHLNKAQRGQWYVL